MKWLIEHIKTAECTSGPARDLWIEMWQQWRMERREKSGPARDLWIEIYPDRYVV